MTSRSRSRLDLWKIVHSFRNEFFTCLFKIQNVQVIQNDVIKCCKMMSSNVAKWCHHIATSQQRGEIVFHVVIFFTFILGVKWPENLKVAFLCTKLHHRKDHFSLSFTLTHTFLQYTQTYQKVIDYTYLSSFERLKQFSFISAAPAYQ